MKEVGVGFLGFGNIGYGVFRAMNQAAEDIAHREGVRFVLHKALVKEISRQDEVEGVAPGILTEDVDEVLSDPRVEIIGEYLGGVHPAREWLLKALENGKSVVTANKEVLASCWHELEAAAKKTGAGIYFEASVGGGIPIIKTMLDSMQSNRIESLMAIINGTTNYILTRMTDEGLPYEAVLAEAQKLGLAEPNPYNDVSGKDAACKLSILSTLAFHARVPLSCIHVEGIEGVAEEDIAFGKEMGMTLKLLAIGKKQGNRVQVRVHPTFIPSSHPLSSVRGSFNAIFMHGDIVGDVMLYGRGAGDMPTSSAIISDFVMAARGQHRYATFENSDKLSDKLILEKDWQCAYYLRLTAKDTPGVLAAVANEFGKKGVSLAQVLQRGEPTEDGVPLLFITHQTHEMALQEVVEAVKKMDVVRAVHSVLRVEGI